MSNIYYLTCGYVKVINDAKSVVGNVSEKIRRVVQVPAQSTSNETAEDA